MRRLSAALVALTAAVALSALSAPAWAAPPKAKPKPIPVKERPLVVSPSQVHSGQSVKVSGGGCQGASAVEFGIDGQGFHRRTAKGGDWSYQVQLPDGLRYGDHHMTAQCKGVKHTPARFHLSRDKRSRGSFHVNPDVAIAGDKVWVDGNGCKKRTAVAITLNGKPIKWLVSDQYGSFDKKVRIPKWAKRGRNVIAPTAAATSATTSSRSRIHTASTTTASTSTRTRCVPATASRSTATTAPPASPTATSTTSRSP
jgi:hypothetical protein